MSLGRLSCGTGDDAEAVVGRVNALLAPYYLTFKPAFNHQRVREVMGDQVWELVATPSEQRPSPDLLPSLPPAVAEEVKVGFDRELAPPTAYVFRAHPDVTAYDLARLQELLGLRLPVGASETDLRNALEMKGLLRFFERQ